MSDLLEEELPPPVLCEEPTMALLLSLGVPTGEWQYYLGFMKRMVELYLTFTSETLQMEKDSLIAEYVYRGKDKGVLEQVQIQAEICVGVRVPELEEGDYSSYSIKSSFDDTDAWNGYQRNDAVFNGAEGKIVLLSPNNLSLKIYDIPTTTLGPAIITDLSHFDSGGASDNYPKKSIYGTYLVVLGYTTLYTDCDKIRIIKDGVIIQTLTDAELGFNANTIRSVAVSPTGKYIIVSGERTASANMGWVLLEGS